MHPSASRILSTLDIEDRSHASPHDLQRALQEIIVDVRLKILDLSNAKYPSDHALSNAQDALRRADSMISTQQEALDRLIASRRQRGRSLPGVILLLLRRPDLKAQAIEQDIITLQFDLGIAAMARGVVEEAHRTSVESHAALRETESRDDRLRISQLQHAAEVLSRARDLALDLPTESKHTTAAAIEHAIGKSAATITTSPNATIALVAALLSAAE